jgi:TatD DNase family protein
MLFDTHCHLDTPAFDADRDTVMLRAQQAGVGRFLNPAFDLDSSGRAVALAQSQADVYAAIGIHPTSTLDFGPDHLTQLRELALSAGPRLVAFGEIGLDYYWKTVEPDVQRTAFVAQLGLARALNLPVIIHCREAYDDALDVLAEHWPGRPLVMHAFGGTVAQAQRALALGYHIGIGGPVTYPSATQTREVVRSLPLDRLLLETDSPYLSPQRHRGKRNEPGYVKLVAEKIADIREMMLVDVADVTTANANRWLGLV